MLTERQKLILQVIVDDFIQTAQPVGSRAISKKKNISYSPATVRNVMADLEEMGFLEKTHSSSGRVPSEKGYRFYVDNLLTMQKPLEDVTVIRQIMHDGFFEFEKLVQKCVEVLSDLTNYTSIILGPEIFETTLNQIQIVPLAPQTAVAILITNNGHVDHHTFSIPKVLDPADLEKMVNILNDRLSGVPIIELPEKLNTEVMELMKLYVSDFEKSYDYIKAAFSNEHQAKLYIGGMANMLMQPEFKDVEKVRSFYAMMEKEEEIANLLKTKKDGIKVSIGHENKVEAIKDLSLITATYHFGDEQMGTIALLGPTRMQYKRVINLLDVLSTEMSDALYTWYKNND
ncbi:heat-inducible transcriptional repressor HrcA [Lentibacillus sp. L22]|uniref:heat-inducible transcriptional repressor HrcA n=1 Tax=Lentibacillus sp. L22 TaxID=3163028 RepID=UPI003466519F